MILSRGVLRQFAVFALVLGLAGCYKSETALITKDLAVYPFTSITFKPPEEGPVLLKRDGDVYQMVEDGEPSPRTFLFYRIDEDLYAIQETAEAGKAVYIFAKKDGEKIVLQNICDGIGEETLKRLKITLDKGTNRELTTCDIPDLQALAGLGRSPALWAAETLTLQIISIE